MAKTFRRRLAACAWPVGLGLAAALLFPPLAAIGFIAALCALPVMLWRGLRRKPTETSQ